MNPSTRSGDLERKKFEKTNQEVIQQNVQLHAQLRCEQKINQETRREIVELKVRVRQLEIENEQLSLELGIIKKEIGERAPTLELISKHVKDLGQYLKEASSSAIIDHRCDENYQESINGLSTKVNGKIKSKVGSMLETIHETQENNFH